MANISRNTFDKLKHYVGVRIQQGSPLLDADWNEEEDICKDELRYFLRWFVGNGIPKGNDGFHILPRAGAANDFFINGGIDEQPGVCLVEGWDARIENGIAYSSQPLFDDDLAREWGTAPLTPLTPPLSGTRTDLVYVDVWEREVTPQEDPGLINPNIELDTCVRIRREWVVRVEQDASELPQAPEGHAFYVLAAITRTAGNNQINQADICDLRRTGLTMASILDSYVGFITAFATPEAPDGWLECNGQTIDRNRYSALFACIGVTFGAGDGVNTFNVPDLRSEFIRGWDHDRGIDPGRTFATSQDDRMQSHKHPDLGHAHSTSGHIHAGGSHAHTDYGHSHPVRRAGYAAVYDDDYKDMGTGRSGYNGTFSTYTARASLSPGTASLVKAYESIQSASASLDNPIDSNGTACHGKETRSRNVALMYCIKY